MDLLGICQNSVSRPSLFSSLWSIQVQHQNEVSDTISQDQFQSGSPYIDRRLEAGIRNAISLYDISNTLTKKLSSRASTCPALLFCPVDVASEEESPAAAKCYIFIDKNELTDHQRYGQSWNSSQKNRNIRDWLQKVSGTDPLSETGSITSVNDGTLNKSPRSQT